MAGPAETVSEGDETPTGGRLPLPSDAATQGDSLDRALTRARVAEALFGDSTAPRTLGRFVVQGRLGAGAMGVVWAAWDPRLERRVAIKRIARIARDPTLDERRRQRLIREAQVLAKLSHPNIVAVHEIDLDGEQTHIVMELVEGKTLAEATSTTRDRPTIVGWYVQAARGLAAAHAAGVIHRDFKPANVLLGDDGRVRVADFGLANTTTTDDGEFVREARARGGEATQESVAIVGTPAYMSPEVMRGEPATAASDQYALCVSLWEALTGARPPSDEALKRGSALPRVLRRALLRGLADDPAKRWPSLDAWIDEVSGEASRRRRRRRLPLAALGLLASTVAGFVVAEVRLTTTCNASTAELRSRLSSDAQAKLIRAIEDTGAANATQIASKTLDHLQAAVATWAQAQTSACRDAASLWSVRSQQGRAAQRCLDERRLRIEAVLDAIPKLDATSAPKVVVAAASVRTDTCSAAGRSDRDDDTMSTSPGGDALEREREVLADIAHIESLLRLGNHARAREVAVEARARPSLAENADSEDERAGVIPLPRRRRLLAELDYVLALAASSAGDAQGALDHAESAYRAALAAGADVFAAKVAARAAWIAASDVGDLDDARRWVQLAEATRERSGRNPSAPSPDLAQAQGLIAFLSGDVREAAEHFARAAGGKARLLGFEHPDVSDALNNLAIAFEELGERPLARSTYLRVLESYESSYGPNHPLVARPLINLGSAEDELGLHDDALSHLERALAIQTTALGPRHPSLALTFDALGYLAKHRCDREAARAHATRALTLREGALGKDHPDLEPSLTGLGLLDLEAGDPERAVARFERAVRLLQEAGSSPTAIGDAYTNLAEAHADAGSWDQVAAHLDLARQAYTTQLDDGAAEWSYWWLVEGRRLLASGAREDGASALRDAMTRARTLDDPRQVAACQLALAQTLGGDVAEARALAGAALQAFESDGACSARGAKAARAFLGLGDAGEVGGATPLVAPSE